MSQRTSRALTEEYNSGSIKIQLDDNCSTFQAGSDISGVVSFSQLKNTYPDAKILNIEFEGEEQLQTKFYNEDSHEIVNKEKQFVNFSVGIPIFQQEYNTEGQHEVPFDLEVPSWVPASLLWVGGRNTRLSVVYRLKAIVQTVNAQKQKQNFTVADKLVIITPNKSSIQQSQKAIVSEFNEKIGGLLSLGATACNATATIPQDYFVFGKRAQIKIDLDNSKCKYKLKHYKIVINRVVLVTNPNDQQEEEQSHSFKSELFSTKIASDCPANGQEIKTLEFDIPNNCQFYDNVHESGYDKKMLKEFPASSKNSYFSIKYHLKVYVKHSVWNQKKGNKIIDRDINIF